MRMVAALVVLPALCVISACGGVSSSLEDPFADAGRNEFRLYVQNDNFYDARISAIASGGSRRQIGYVGGKTDGVFTVPWTFSNDLRVEIDLQAGPTCTTEVIQVDPGDELRLQILSAITDSSFCR
jgi:hypothetical protein